MLRGLAQHVPGEQALLGLQIVAQGGARQRLLAWLAFGTLTVGGMILGPIVQKHAFGAYWTGFAVRIGSFAWIGFESLRYHGLLRRRIALGLTSPLMAHRFLLWGFSGAMATFSYLIYLGFELAGSALGEAALPTLLVGALGLATGAATWLAFLPPAFYRRWIDASVAPA